MPILTLTAAIAALYVYALGGVGMLGPDEPRYAAIGRAMARTGDFVTPRLWSSPWFEKPPLLYWMTAAGTLAGLGPELAARLPVVLLSLVFLGASYALLLDEFGFKTAAVSTTLLASSAAWIAFTDLSLTDLPLAVFFSLAVFLALPLLRFKPELQHICWRFAAIGACLGIAALAKGLVPIGLALPLFWFLRPYWRDWWSAVAALFAVALPWYVAVTARNGPAFLQEFFLKHHFERLYSSALQHVQPWYYYVPVLLLALFPWTPLLFAAARIPWDQRRRFLAAVFLFGFLAFSLSLNKLPGYLLPLLPSLFVLIASGFESLPLARLPRWWMFACAVLIATLPPLARALPLALITGRFSAIAVTHLSRVELFFAASPILVVLLARRSWIGPLLVLCIVAGGIYLKTLAFPILDRFVSARWYAAQISNLHAICDGGMNRDWIFGISFYRDTALKPCATGKFDFAIRSQGRAMPTVEPLKP
ncbi:MAG: phospholipid carrier-dependent glycosyltransferase [Acidobacteriaceae bacterium]|nr:phospholipid carrier-dependent glycosyltransferase [Acidobacteriaceae bacterium]